MWSTKYVLSVLNLFYHNIKFTYEKKNNNGLAFLNVLFIRGHDKTNITILRKDTNNDLYSHWESFSPINWKQGRLKSLISRAYMIFSN